VEGADLYAVSTLSAAPSPCSFIFFGFRYGRPRKRKMRRQTSFKRHVPPSQLASGMEVSFTHHNQIQTIFKMPDKGP